MSCGIVCLLKAGISRETCTYITLALTIGFSFNLIFYVQQKTAVAVAHVKRGHGLIKLNGKG